MGVRWARGAAAAILGRRYDALRRGAVGGRRAALPLVAPPRRRRGAGVSPQSSGCALQCLLLSVGVCPVCNGVSLSCRRHGEPQST